MKNVLHIPNDWRTLWGPAIDAVKTDAKFSEHHKKYCRLCEEGSTLEKDFYPPLMKAANTVLDVVSWSNFKGIPSEKHQYYHVNCQGHSTLTLSECSAPSQGRSSPTRNSR